MKRTKIVFSIVLAAIFLATQIMAVGAAPARQEPPITGKVESITLVPDAETGETTVEVVLSDGMGGPQTTVRLSLEDAQFLNLVTLEGEPVDPKTILLPVEIDPGMVIPDTEEETEEQAEHPVGSAISEFFSDLFGVDYDTVMDYHDDGAGFGVIVQALWMTTALEGDSETFAAIMEAKQNKDYSAIELPDGSTPQNWGQFRKAVMQDREKSKENLGAIMSGRADEDQEEVPTAEDQILGNGNGKGPDQDKSNNGKNNNGNNKNKDKDKGKGK